MTAKQGIKNYSRLEKPSEISALIERLISLDT